MSIHSDAVHWYANPRNWETGSSQQTPYSASIVSSVALDRGASARKQLNTKGTSGGLICLVLGLLGENTAGLARKSGIHPGRLEDLMQDAADPLSSERAQLARALGISENEF